MDEWVVIKMLKNFLFFISISTRRIVFCGLVGFLLFLTGKLSGIQRLTTSFISMKGAQHQKK